jgi:hypothetical protein
MKKIILILLGLSLSAAAMDPAGQDENNQPYANPSNNNANPARADDNQHQRMSIEDFLAAAVIQLIRSEDSSIIIPMRGPDGRERIVLVERLDSCTDPNCPNCKNRRNSEN